MYKEHLFLWVCVCWHFISTKNFRPRQSTCSSALFFGLEQRLLVSKHRNGHVSFQRLQAPQQNGDRLQLPRFTGCIHQTMWKNALQGLCTLLQQACSMSFKVNCGDPTGEADSRLMAACVYIYQDFNNPVATWNDRQIILADPGFKNSFMSC